MREVKIGDEIVGDEKPVFIIAEIGINHNGDIKLAKELIDAAKNAGCNAVKFQKREPDICVPEHQKNVLKETPWGNMSYLEYKKRIEFGGREYEEIDTYCREKKIMWFASCWDKPSVDFIEKFSPSCYKIPSACLTKEDLLLHIKSKGAPIILSTGMSTMEEIEHAVDILGKEELVILHCTSTYPSKPNELNLKVIKTLKEKFQCPIGYSGHEVGVFPSVAAVMLGACAVERHITLDRAMYGSDQSASLEPQGFKRMVRDIRLIIDITGDGEKKVYASEIPILEKLRRTR